MVKYMDPFSLYQLARTENKEVRDFFIRQNVWQRYFVDRYDMVEKWNRPGTNWLWAFFATYAPELKGVILFKGADDTRFSVMGNYFAWNTRGNPEDVVRKLYPLRHLTRPMSRISMYIDPQRVDEALYILFASGLRLMQTGYTYKDFKTIDWECGISCEVCQTQPAEFKNRTTNQFVCSYECAQK